MNSLMQKIRHGYLIVSIIILIISCQVNPDPFDLQTRFINAESVQEKTKILNNLEQYYLDLYIPDSIHDEVNKHVRDLLSTNLKIPEFADMMSSSETNIYQMENELQNMYTNAAITFLNDDFEKSRSYLTTIEKMVQIINSQTKTPYWTEFNQRFKVYTEREIKLWLKAKSSAKFSAKYYTDARYWKSGELFAALGLQLLKEIDDFRLRLDCIQRLQVILYQYYSFYDLSLALAQRYFQKADSIKYYLRANGILYNHANALYLAGKNEEALSQFEKVIKRAEQFDFVPFMEWYEKNGLLRFSLVLWQLGKYSDALDVCDQIELMELSVNDEIELHAAKAANYISMGHYELAEWEYKTALNKAEVNNRIDEKILILNNLGHLYKSLTEFDKGYECYNKAKFLLDNYNPSYYEYKMLIISNMIEIDQFVTSPVESKDLLNEATSIIDRINLPLRKAQFLRTLGQCYLNLKEYRKAFNNFQKSIDIYEKNGLLRLEMLAKIDLIKSLKGISEYSKAEAEAKDLISKAEEIGDPEISIDASSMLLEIYMNTKKYDKALLISKQLIRKIDRSSITFNKTERLVSYRQKIYECLKNTIICEIRNNRIDSAFIKLDYAKAYAMKQQINIGGETYKTRLKYMDVDEVKKRLDMKEVLLDYFISNDSLYVFMLDSENLKLLRKELEKNSLQSLVNSYTDLILNSYKILNDYDKNNLIKNFNLITRTGKQLFDILINWPSVSSTIHDFDAVYIIPDDCLYNLPFCTLVSDTQNTVTYLIEDAAMVCLSGASSLKAGKKSIISLKDKTVLICADPSFVKTKDFIKNMRRIFPKSEVLHVSDYSYDKQAILNKLSEGYDIYIVIGHSEANTVNPDLSYLELTSLSPEYENSKKIRLTSNDLKQINWKGTELVVLLGCETAGGKLYRGTGIWGLQQKFISLGVQNVLASLWKIDANYAIPQMQEILNDISHTNDLASTIRRIQKNSINKLKDDKFYELPHPYFWGNFQLASLTE